MMWSVNRIISAHPFPSTEGRVQRHTSARSASRIHGRTLHNLARYIGAPPGTIDERIDQLKREWDIERTLEANAASVALLGLGLGLAVDIRLLLIPAAVAGFLLQHALQGWCPPLPLFRSLGIRTAEEIHEEIVALRILRGDFVEPVSNPENALANARH